MLLFQLILLCLSTNAAFGIAAQTAIFWSKTIIGVLDETVDIYESISGHNVFGQSAQEKRLYAKLANITDLVERLEHDIPQVTIARIKELERDFSQIIHFEIKLDDLVNYIGNIESKYEKFGKLRNKVMNLDKESANKSIATKHTLERTANAILFESGNVGDSLDKINQIILGENVLFGKQDVFSLILDNFNSKTQSRCLVPKSPQQLVHDVFNSLRMVQVKGIIMTEFSYMILSLYTSGDYKEYADEFHDTMIKRLNKQAQVANEVMKKADNSLWKCDPDQYVFNKTYIEVTRLIQGYIQNEIELSHDRNCFDGCGYYSYVNKPGCSNQDSLCKQQPKCNGRVFDCRLVDEDMNICFSPISSTRRYDWIRHDKAESYGQVDKKCTNFEGRIKMYRKYLAWRCFYCFCYCDEESHNSDRFFSLLPATSDIKNNKVVVGVRFIKHERVIHLQVKEGTLLPGGLIDKDSVSWVPVSTIDVDNWLEKHKYHTMRYESRSIDLDDVVASKNYVLTGVKLRTLGEHLNLEIQLTAFNFTTGEVSNNLSFWKGNDNTDASETPREKHRLLTKRPATLSQGDFSLPDSKPDSYVEFTHSDERSDAAQSTVPFIDIQEVASDPPMPLIGMGLIHKQSRGSAGFIEPKVFTYNVGEELLANQLHSRRK
ncbi:uncharacterized protein LOC135831598 [Planococcus citri]|uniref:uncharacterized protein LOC135831598 n=1 Tax=Planococcus citri TaxID=170843 RepID=UPI0031F97B43